MSDMYRVLCVVCVWLLFHLVCCRNVTYVGRLTPDCVTSYHRIILSRRVPPRTYLYFHEAMPQDQLSRDGEEPREEDQDGPVDLQWRIVGGRQVSIKQVPYQVLYGMYCGGTLIAPDWVITAAHCKDKEKFILAGSTQRSQATKYMICAHFLHPLWNTTHLHTHDYDYQLVLLEQAVPVTPNSRPIAIGNVDDIREGEMITVSGWGHTKYKQRVMQDIVRRVRVPVMAHEICKSLPLMNYKTITPRMFCGGYLNGSKDSCQGDSGGPAILHGKLVGLVSFGVGCAMKDQPGVYSNIPLVRNWIRQVTGLPL
ncbi:trypsin 3A1-like [Spodoptera frugiperda]|uniref:trypsin n=1 Tax=Spodoptera frugiperda TaxID=7108 RepID=A0A9R0DZ41_SPOFR|nr:trypsin 3A1-like [Spodoptera frugiperda]